MSGPKVVRVRTRDEIAAECYGLVDALRAAIEQCEVFARRHDFLDATSAEKSSALVTDLMQKVHAGDFEAVRRVCQIETATVRSEHEHLENEVLRRAAEAANRRRRCQYMAVSLAEQLRRSGKPIPPEIKAAQLGNIGDRDEDLKTVEAVVSRVLAALTLEGVRDDGRTMTDGQRRLAELLSVNGADAATEPVHSTISQSNSAIKRLDRATVETRTLDETAAGRQLLERMQALLDDPDAPESSMRIDSLLLEWSQRRGKLRELADKRTRAKQLAFELTRITEAQASRLADHLLEATELELDTALADAKTYIDRNVRERNATQRRKAVLSGLAALGYEIGSELSTAWSERGRVIVAKPERPGYGVELSGPLDGNQLQVRVVAFSDPQADGDAARDRDAEVLWCSEFAKLQQILGREGTSVNVLRALGVGAVPVSRVGVADTEEQERNTSDHVQSIKHS